MKSFPVPLIVDCSFLGESLIRELRYRLEKHFKDVERFNNSSDTLWCIKPLSERDYHRAWKVLDRYGVKVI